MLWNKVGVHLNMGEALGVPGEVDLEIAFGGEPVTTNITLVGSFTGVRS